MTPFGRFAREALDDADGDGALWSAWPSGVLLNWAPLTVSLRSVCATLTEPMRTGTVESCCAWSVADDRRLRARHDGHRVQVPDLAVVVDELVLPRRRVVDVDPEVGRRRRLLVEVVHRAVGPRGEDAAVGQHARLAVAADGRRVASSRDVRGEHREVHVLLVEARVADVPPFVYVRGSMHTGSAWLRESIWMSAPAWIVRSRSVPMPIMTFGEISWTLKSESQGLPPWSFCAPSIPGDADLLRPVRVGGEELHVVGRAEVLPARVRDAPVVAEERRTVCERFCGKRRRSASPPSTEIVASCTPRASARTRRRASPSPCTSRS